MSVFLSFFWLEDAYFDASHKKFDLFIRVYNLRKFGHARESARGHVRSSSTLLSPPLAVVGKGGKGGLKEMADGRGLVRTVDAVLATIS